MTRVPRALLLSAACWLSFGTPAAVAKPEWHVGIQPAFALEPAGGDLRPAFLPSATLDLTFGRERAGQAGWGPVVEVGSWAFSDLRTAALGQLIVPLGALDLAFAAGPEWQLGSPGGAAIAGRTFLGYRAFNHTGAYGTGFGLFAGLDQPLHRAPTTWLVGLHLDGMWTSLPFVALASWIRGTPD